MWWISADTPAAISAGLADLAVAIAPDSATVPVEQRTESAIQWLSEHRDWLLVLDNLTTTSDADDVLARIRTGMIVITSISANPL